MIGEPGLSASRHSDLFSVDILILLQFHASSMAEFMQDVLSGLERNDDSEHDIAGINSERDDGPEVSIESSKRGRPSCSVWGLLTDEANASSKTQAVCKSCNQTVKYHKMSEIAKKLPNLIKSMPLLSPEERDYMLKLSQHRFDFMYGDAHGIAYLLDPRFVGVGMPVALREKVEEMIYQHNVRATGSETSEQLMEAMFTDYTNYRIAALEQLATDPPTLAFRMIKEKKVSILKWWQSRGDRWPALQRLALQVFGMVASSAASERNFSTFGFIHSKPRNCLNEESVQKLVYIKTNNIQFTKQQMVAIEFEYASEEDLFE